MRNYNTGYLLMICAALETSQSAFDKRAGRVNSQEKVSPMPSLNWLCRIFNKGGLRNTFSMGHAGSGKRSNGPCTLGKRGVDQFLQTPHPGQDVE